MRARNVHPDVKRSGNGPASATNYHHRNHLATIMAVTGTDKSLAQKSNFTTWGTRQVVAGAAFPQSKGFIGERDDPETGLVYLNARYYDTAIGRFISPD